MKNKIVNCIGGSLNLNYWPSYPHLKGTRALVQTTRQENYLNTFFDISGDDLRRVVEKIHQIGKMPSKINSTFIEVIPKLYFPNTFYDFHPIALCHCLYKIISKVIAVSLKPLLSNVISSKQFRFLKG
jgi:hypothetical protein